MALKIAQRARVDPFIVMDVMRAANEREATGAGVLHLEVGQPGTAAPRPVLEAARAALMDDRLGYTDALGVPALREYLAQHYRDFYGLKVGAERIIVTTGSSGAFLLAFLAAFDPGDRVAMAVPGYPAYRNILTALGIQPVLLPSRAADRFQPTVELLQREPERVDGLIVASPSNPTGTMLGDAEMRELASYCRTNGVRLISDEIYHGLSYGRSAVSALTADNEAIVINSFSKYFSMTGWRLGWMVVPEGMVRPMECLLQNLFISAPTLSQLAACTVFGCHDALQLNVAHYAESRELLLQRLPKAGFEDLAPADGAFYIYANVERLTNDSAVFCRRMLSEIGVATTPGVDFDPENGHRFVRFSFAGSTPEIVEATERLVSWRHRSA